MEGLKKQRAYNLGAVIGRLSGPLARCSSGWGGLWPSLARNDQKRQLPQKKLTTTTLRPPPAGDTHTSVLRPSPLHILRRDGTMLRQTLARSAWRTGKHPASAASRAFSATAQRPAEVELTIGAPPALLAPPIGLLH